MAQVAQREGWADPRRPPAAHGPRSLHEALAIARFEEAARARGRGRPEPSPRRRLWSWAAMAVLGLALLGFCWYVSPGRTLLAIAGVALFCLLAMQRRARKGSRSGRRPGAAARPFR